MRMYDIIRKKRDGGHLSRDEIRFFTEGYVRGDIPDYQAAALCMAIYFRGMDVDETAELTYAIRDSGEKLDLSGIDGIRADKHSTGGVGDKTSLIVAPIVATFGVRVAKVSGRGLGHTGGTIDKLESIPGFRTDLSEKEFAECVRKAGVAIIGQTGEMAPADRLLYALRDVTATVDSLPLIVSSIMGKKLAADDDVIVLDVKNGSGSFNRTIDDSLKLARAMVDIGRKAGKKIMALITDMDRPLGNEIGNSLEVIEAFETLKGNGPADLHALCVTLAGRMLSLSGLGTPAECEKMADRAIKDGSALETFGKMISAQGGDPRVTSDYSLFRKAPLDREVKSERTGYISSVDTAKYGMAALALGAGRNTKEDTIDHSAGITLIKKTGDRVEKGETVAVLHGSAERSLDQAERIVLDATVLLDEKPELPPLILGKVE